MQKNWILNKEDLEVNERRKVALDLINEAYNSIDTKKVVLDKIKLEDENLFIEEKIFDLSLFENIKVVGFGKSSSDCALALESVLGDKISGGIVVDTKKEDLKYIESFVGTHPLPSEQNVLPGQKIFELISNSSSRDLIIVISSGGGSALLNYPESEFLQGKRLYEDLLSKGKTISEMNKIRKHLSLMKGGGLLKIAYPATIVGLIFSDVPGNHFEDVASGPTYKDISTKEEVENILKENNLESYDLIETPKEDIYFEKVHNFVLVSNEIALASMEKKAKSLGLEVFVAGSEFYEKTDEVVQKICLKKDNTNYVVLGAGEPKIEVTKKGGKGGRNTHMVLLSLSEGFVSENTLFTSFASDGIDNTDSAGAISDIETLKKIKDLNENIYLYKENFDSYSLFSKTKDLIQTGKTGANVSDLFFFLKINNNEK